MKGSRSQRKRGFWSDTYHGHMTSLPPGCWGRSKARRQEVDTAKELRGKRETKRETDTGKEKEKTVRSGPRNWGNSGRQPKVLP